MNKKSRIGTGLKVVISLTILWYCFIVFSEDEHISADLWWTVRELWEKQKWGLLMPMLLIPVNWGLEALKWQFLVRSVQRLSFTQAFVSVLAGLSLGFVTPRSLGDYAGRYLALDGPNRIKVVGALSVSRLSQLLVTLVVGLAGLVYFHLHGLLPALASEAFSIGGAILLCLLLIVTYLIRVPLFRLLNRLRLVRPVLKMFVLIREYSSSDYLLVLGLSFVRYWVFTIQFILVFGLMGVEVNALLCFGVSLVFLAKSIVLSFNFLSDLGVREASALFFIGKLGVPADIILASSLLIWMMNILGPTILGAFCVWGLKFSALRKGGKLF